VVRGGLFDEEAAALPLPRREAIVASSVTNEDIKSGRDLNALNIAKKGDSVCPVRTKDRSSRSMVFPITADAPGGQSIEVLGRNASRRQAKVGILNKCLPRQSK
jgi:hypothetical protein